MEKWKSIASPTSVTSLNDLLLHSKRESAKQNNNLGTPMQRVDYLNNT
jgi:hypothetical protein